MQNFQRYHSIDSIEFGIGVISAVGEGANSKSESGEQYSKTK